jgi:hypothetical protein
MSWTKLGDTISRRLEGGKVAVGIDVGKVVGQCVKTIGEELVMGRASEESHYSAFKALIEGCGEGINAHIVEKGMPAKVGPAPLLLLKGYDASRERSKLING